MNADPGASEAPAAAAEVPAAAAEVPTAASDRGARALARADALDRMQKREGDIRDLRLSARLITALAWAVQAIWGGVDEMQVLLVSATVVTGLAVVVEGLAAVRLRRIAKVRGALAADQIESRRSTR